MEYSGGNAPGRSGAVLWNVTGKELSNSGIPLLYINNKFNL